MRGAGQGGPEAARAGGERRGPGGRQEAAGPEAKGLRPPARPSLSSGREPREAAGAEGPRSESGPPPQGGALPRGGAGGGMAECLLRAPRSPLLAGAGDAGAKRRRAVCVAGRELSWQRGAEEQDRTEEGLGLSSPLQFGAVILSVRRARSKGCKAVKE